MILNHCLNRPLAHGQAYALKLGNIESFIYRKEASCLWALVQRKKFSAVNTVISYTPKTITRHLSNLAERFHCTQAELLHYAKQNEFREHYYKIANNPEGSKHVYHQHACN